MIIDDIYNEWEKDGEIIINDLSYNGQMIPKLHNKYYKMYVDKSLLLKKNRADLKLLQKLKGEYYRGELTSDELKKYGWSPFAIKLLKTDVQQYIDSDKDIIDLTLKIGLYEEVVAYLDSIIKQINNRNYVLKLILDFEKFKNGT